jgi:hypothetical protein
MEFALFAPAGVELKLLSDAAGYKETLLPAFQKWAEQYGATRPVEVRIAPAQGAEFARPPGGGGRHVGVDRRSILQQACRARTDVIRENWRRHCGAEDSCTPGYLEQRKYSYRRAA